MPSKTRRVRTARRSRKVRGEGRVCGGLSLSRIRSSTHRRRGLRGAWRFRQAKKHRARPENRLHAGDFGLPGLREVRGRLPRERHQARARSNVKRRPSSRSPSVIIARAGDCPRPARKRRPIRWDRPSRRRHRSLRLPRASPFLRQGSHSIRLVRRATGRNSGHWGRHGCYRKRARRTSWARRS